MPVAHDLNDSALNVAIKSKDQLIRFLNNSGRRFFVMRSEDLINSLPHFEDGVLAIQNIVSCYRDFRRCIPTDRTELVANPITSSAIEVMVMKDESLEPEEYDDLIEWAKTERAKAVDRNERAKPIVRR